MSEEILDETLHYIEAVNATLIALSNAYTELQTQVDALKMAKKEEKSLAILPHEAELQELADKFPVGSYVVAFLKLGDNLHYYFGQVKIRGLGCYDRYVEDSFGSEQFTFSYYVSSDMFGIQKVDVPE